ncbi:hypothetical protein Tsubulata_022724 [Turnera subulata]|uniref:Pectinesterase inhibitor domain-containing protein n=1 Tax=Turnera subulata TaxID=218843 RepID=A0A9Q0F256_9ROSI|nr:hypothetical protein Tsubulata_022724 [Turnera subulata]
MCVESLSPYAPSIQESNRRFIYTAVNVIPANVQYTMTLMDNFKKMKGLTFIETGLLSSCFEMFSLNVSSLIELSGELDIMYKSKGPEVLAGGGGDNFVTCNDEFDLRKEVVKLKALVISRVVNVTHILFNILDVLAGGTGDNFATCNDEFDLWKEDIHSCLHWFLHMDGAVLENHWCKSEDEIHHAMDFTLTTCNKHTPHHPLPPPPNTAPSHLPSPPPRFCHCRGKPPPLPPCSRDRPHPSPPPTHTTTPLDVDTPPATSPHFLTSRATPTTTTDATGDRLQQRRLGSPPPRAVCSAADAVRHEQAAADAQKAGPSFPLVTVAPSSPQAAVRRLVRPCSHATARSRRRRPALGEHGAPRNRLRQIMPPPIAPTWAGGLDIALGLAQSRDLTTRSLRS